MLFLGLLAFGALVLGLRVAVIETDLEQLWVEGELWTLTRAVWVWRAQDKNGVRSWLLSCSELGSGSGGGTCPLEPGHLGALLPPTLVSGRVQMMEPCEWAHRMEVSACVQRSAPTFSVNF